MRACSPAIQTVRGHALKIVGVSDCRLEVEDCIIQYQFLVTKGIQQTILGADFLRVLGAVIDTE